MTCGAVGRAVAVRWLWGPEDGPTSPGPAAGENRPFCYTVEETARCLSIARGTVRRWLKQGLTAIDGGKPALIRGSDLRAYLNAKARPKQSCPPGQCYCVKCKAPKEPAGAMAEYVVMTPTNGNLEGNLPGLWDAHASPHINIATKQFGSSWT